MIESVVAKCFTLINYPMAIAGFKGLQPVTHIKERRHVAKILTIIFRDFPQVIHSTNFEHTLQFVWKLTI